MIIAESHISIHTFPNRDYVNIDVFSCRTFDNQRVLRDAKELFSLSEVRTWLLDRGLEHLDQRGLLQPGQGTGVLANQVSQDPVAGAKDKKGAK